MSRTSVADLGDARRLLHQRFPQLKIVDTGWTPN
jgi:hypothetical protein